MKIWNIVWITVVVATMSIIVANGNDTFEHIQKAVDAHSKFTF